MGAFRALLFAVFGGFISAAPAAPLVADSHGAVSDSAKQTQKSERPLAEASERSAAAIAAAPPHAGGAPPAAYAAPSPAAPPQDSPAPILPERGRSVPPPPAGVRAGHLDLPPPVR